MRSMQWNSWHWLVCGSWLRLCRPFLIVLTPHLTLPTRVGKFHDPVFSSCLHFWQDLKSIASSSTIHILKAIFRRHFIHVIRRKKKRRCHLLKRQKLIIFSCISVAKSIIFLLYLLVISYIVNQTNSIYLKNKLPIPYKVLWASQWIHAWASCRWYLKFKDETISLQFLVGASLCFLFYNCFSHSWWLFLRTFGFHCLWVGPSSQREADPPLKGPCTHVWVACEPPAHRQDQPNL